MQKKSEDCPHVLLHWDTPGMRSFRTIAYALSFRFKMNVQSRLDSMGYRFSKQLKSHLLAQLLWA